MSSAAAWNGAHAGAAGELGCPVRANVVQYETIASASFCWSASSPGAGTVTGRSNTYWTSEACAAAYGNATGGRNRCGALGSLNSYANTGTNCDIFCSANRALQAKIP